MIRHRTPAFGLALSGLMAAALASPSARGQAPAANANADAAVPSRFVRVEEPITTEAISRIRKGVQAFLDAEGRDAGGGDARRAVPILVFEFLPGTTEPGNSSYGASLDLARYLLNEIDHARLRTVAFVPQGLRGYAVLPALACDELAMAPDARLGPITPQGKAEDEGVRAFVKILAAKNGRDAYLGLLFGMLDPTLDVRRIRTADKQVHFLTAEEAAQFRLNNQVEDDQAAWEGGNRGEVSAESSGGLVKVQAAGPGDIRRAYNLKSTAYAIAPDEESGELALDGPITSSVAEVAARYFNAEAEKKTKRIFVRINSLGGDQNAATIIANAILKHPEIQTVAYIEEQALGASALIPLACNEIVFQKGARLGDAGRPLAGGPPGDRVDPSVLAEAAEGFARARGHSTALARAFVDPRAVVVRARINDANAVVLMLESELEPNKHTFLETIKPEGTTLTIGADEALTLGLASQIVGSDRELYSSYGLEGRPKGAKATWVDNLVSTLNDPWMSGLLLFVGLFMLILELKLPGVGLPAIISALAFLLFFWSHYLGGSADGLEILLFLVGIVCLALELFVFPGFAVFGLSGILLILVSVIMASHTFVWPTKDYEFRQMGHTLIEVASSIVMVTVGAIAVGRYFPSLPLFRRMVLHPVPVGTDIDEATGKPIASGEATYFHLLGEVGHSTTALKPTGKARFGESLIDVTADGFYIEPGAAVEVVEVQGPKVIVKRA